MPRYERRPLHVEAIKLVEQVSLANGQHGKAGDWLIIYPESHEGERQVIMTAEAFEKEFRPRANDAKQFLDQLITSEPGYWRTGPYISEPYIGQPYTDQSPITLGSPNTTIVSTEGTAGSGSGTSLQLIKTSSKK